MINVQLCHEHKHIRLDMSYNVIHLLTLSLIMRMLRQHLLSLLLLLPLMLLIRQTLLSLLFC